MSQDNEAGEESAGGNGTPDEFTQYGFCSEEIPQYKIEVGNSPLVCGSCHTGSEPRLCTGCMVIAYCSQDCQVNHRKEHKRLCRKVSNLRKQQKELRESSEYSENLFRASAAFKISYYENGIELANAMLAMAYYQTNLDRRSYEIVLQQYVNLLEASEAAFNAQLDDMDHQDVVKFINPHANSDTLILLLVALGRNDDAMTLLYTRAEYHRFWSDASSIGGDGDRLSAFDFVENYATLDVVNHACMAVVRCRVVADMKENESKWRAVLDTPSTHESDGSDPVSPSLSSFLPKRSYDEEMREQIRDIEYQAGWTQRNCDQFFTGLLLSERNPQSHALAKQAVLNEIGLSPECFLLMKDCFTKSQQVSQVMQTHVLSRVTVSLGSFRLN